MRGTLIYGDHDVRVEDLPDPRLTAPTDAIVQVLLACVCGSDLWGYRGVWEYQQPARAGHEFIGLVTEVGADVQSVSSGDLVIAPFCWSDGTCDYCRLGLQSSCVNGGGFGEAGSDGGQGQYVRVPFADGTLVSAPIAPDDDRLVSILPLSDVLATGHHAAVSAGVRPGSTVTVAGDGAVGLCAILASRRLGAERIIALSRNPERSRLARAFGAAEVLSERGEQAAERVRDLTDGLGTDFALECVGTDLSWRSAIGSVRDGGRIGFVGVPAGVSEWIRPRELYGRNVGVAGGVAPVRAYIPELLTDVLDGTLDASPIFDLEVDLDHVPDGYLAMDERRAIKAMIRI